MEEKRLTVIKNLAKVSVNKHMGTKKKNTDIYVMREMAKNKGR